MQPLGRASSSYDAQHDLIQAARARAQGLPPPQPTIDVYAATARSHRHAAAAGHPDAQRWGGAQTARTSYAVSGVSRAPHPSGPLSDPALLNMALAGATAAAAQGPSQQPQRRRGRRSATMQQSGGVAGAGASAAAVQATQLPLAPHRQPAPDLPPPGSGRWTAVPGATVSAPSSTAPAIPGQHGSSTARAATATPAPVPAGGSSTGRRRPARRPSQSNLPPRPTLHADLHTSPHAASAASGAVSASRTLPLSLSAREGSVRTSSVAPRPSHAAAAAATSSTGKLPAVGGSASGHRSSTASLQSPTATAPRQSTSVASPASQSGLVFSFTMPAGSSAGSLAPHPPTAAAAGGGSAASLRLEQSRRSGGRGSTASLASVPVLQRKGSETGSITAQSHALQRSSSALGSVSSNLSAAAAAAAATAVVAVAPVTQSAAQQAHNTMTMDELMAEAWKMHSRHGSVSSLPSSGGGDITAGGVRMARRLAPGAEAGCESGGDVAHLPAITRASLEAFVRDVWAAILRDKVAAGVGLGVGSGAVAATAGAAATGKGGESGECASSAMRHALQRFERRFLRLHDGPLCSRHGADGGGGGSTLRLSSCGLGSRAGKVVAQFVRAQTRFSELELGHNALGQKGIAHILKLLKKPRAAAAAVLGGGSGGSTATSPRGTRKPGGDDGATPPQIKPGTIAEERGRDRRARSSSPAATGARERHSRLSGRDASSKQPRTGSVPPPRSSRCTGSIDRNSQSSLRAAGAAVVVAPLIHRLDLSYNGLNPAGFEAVAAALKNSSLRSLDLSSDHASATDQANRMGAAGGAALGAALAALDCPLQELRLAGVGGPGFATLMREGLLRAAPYSQLQHLDVRGNWLAPDALAMLLRAARRGMVHLSTLRLARNRIGGPAAQLLCEYLRTTTVLKLLDLSTCCIATSAIGSSSAASASGAAAPEASYGGSAGAASAASSCIGAGRDFCMQLLEAMACNRRYCSVETILLDENDLGDHGARQLGLGLALLHSHLPNLRALSLANCNITDVQWLSYGVGRCASLRRLNLSSNALGDSGAIALSLALQGRLELDAPLVPVLALHRRDGGGAECDSEEEQEEEEEEEPDLASDAETDAAAEARRDAHEAAQRQVRRSSAPLLLLGEALKSGASLLRVEATPQASADAAPDEGEEEEEAPLDLLADAGLKQASPGASATASTAAFAPVSSARTHPPFGAGAAPPRPRLPRDATGTRHNRFWKLSSQQLNSARLHNAKRVIVYTHSVPISTDHANAAFAPRCGLHHLNLTHAALGDRAATHLAQVVSLNGSLRELILADNDITSVGGQALLDGVKSVVPLGCITLQRLALQQNRVGTAILAALGAITAARRHAHEAQRVRAYKAELAQHKRAQRRQLGGYIVSIRAAMECDEETRRALAAAQIDLERTRAEEEARTAALQAELEALRRDQSGLYAAQLPQYEELVSRRAGALHAEHGARALALLEGLHLEQQQSARLRHRLEGEMRSRLEQERAEAVLERRPLAAALEADSRQAAALKSQVVRARGEKAVFEEAVLRTYVAVLRNCGKGEREWIDPERAPELFAQTRRDLALAAAAAKAQQQAAAEAAAAASVGLGESSSSTVPSPSSTSRVLFTLPDGAGSGGGDSSTSTSPQLPRKKHSVFFGAAGAALDAEAEERDRAARARAEAAAALALNDGRPLTPRLLSALRYLSAWPAQADRAAVQARLVHAASTTGRPIDRFPGATRQSDLDRLSPCTRSAVQRLRGDVQTEWEARKEAEAMLAARKRAEAEARRASNAQGAAARRRSRAMLAAANGTAPAPGAGVSAVTHFSPSATSAALAAGDDHSLGTDAAASSTSPSSSAAGAAHPDAGPVRLAIELVTNLLQLTPLTKIQGSHSLYSLAMRGLGLGGSGGGGGGGGEVGPGRIFVTLHSSPDASAMERAWEERYGVYKPALGRRVPLRPGTRPEHKEQLGEERFASASASDSAASLAMAALPPPPLTFTCTTEATSSVLIRLVAEALQVPISAINSLSFQEQKEQRADAGAVQGIGGAAGVSAGLGAAGAGNELVRLIREKELKELSERRKRQQEAKGSHPSSLQHGSRQRGRTATPRKASSNKGGRKKGKSGVVDASAAAASAPAPVVEVAAMTVDAVPSDGDALATSSAGYDASPYDSAATVAHHSSGTGAASTAPAASKPAAHTSDPQAAPRTSRPRVSDKVAAAALTRALQQVNLVPFGRNHVQAAAAVRPSASP